MKTFLFIFWLCFQSFSCRADWELPAQDISSTGQVAYNPQIAMDDLGNAVVVWRRSDGSHYIVQTRRYSAETSTWSSVQNLSVVGQHTFDPQVAMDGLGNAIVVWRRTDGRNYIVQTRRYNTETSTWSAVQTLSVAGQISYDPQISMDTLGNAITIWRRYDGSHYIVQARRYNVETDTWASVQDLSDVGEHTFDPQVALAMNELGNAVAVWRRTDGRNYIVQTRIYNAETNTWSSVQDLSVSGQIAYDPQVAIDELGNAVAVWRRYNGSHYIVQTRRYSVENSTWSSVQNLSVVGQDSYGPQVAVDFLGNAVAVWHRYDVNNYRVKARRYDVQADTWSSLQDLSASGQVTYDPQVAMDALGNATVVWRRSDGSHYIVQTSRYNAETSTWSTVQDLSVAGNNTFHPQVAMDTLGDAVVVWRRSDGRNYIVQASRYDAEVGA